MEILSSKVSKNGICTILHNYSPDDNELYVDEIGHIITEPMREQSFERGNYCIHYCIRGKAKVNGVDISAGQGYIMPPMSKIKYTADKEDPYEYTWIILGGTKAKYFLRGCGFDGKFQIFEFDNVQYIARTIRDACYINYSDKNFNLYLMSVLFKIMSYHKKPENVQEIGHFVDDSAVGAEYVKEALINIHANYAGNISVEFIAKQVNISQNYLCRLFNKILFCSPQVYIAKYRVEIAKKLLVQTQRSITDIAESVGYFDPQHFSQVFKKYTKKTPKEYRKAYKEK